MANDLSHLGNKRRFVNDDSMAGLGFAQPRHISRNNNRFTLVSENGQEVPVNLADGELGFYLDLVVVDANPHTSRIYWDPTKKYQPGDNTPPLCWSDNGIAPSVNAAVPQAPRCDHSCPQNIRGSAISFNKVEITACQYRKKLAVMVVDSKTGEPFDHPSVQGVWQFVIPPASLKKYGTYLKWVTQQDVPGVGRKADVSDFVTRVYYEPTATAKAPNELAFRAVNWIGAQTATLEDQLAESNVCDELIGRNDVPRTAALPAPMGGPAARQQATLDAITGNVGQERRPSQVAPPPREPELLPPGGNGGSPFGRPTAPAASAPATPSAPQGGAPFGGQPSGSPFGAPSAPGPSSGPEPEKKPKGRPRGSSKKQDEPAFLQGQSQPTVDMKPQTAPQFGVGQPAQPNKDVLDSVHAAFKL